MPHDAPLLVQERAAARGTSGRRISIGVSDAAAAPFNWLTNWRPLPSAPEGDDFIFDARPRIGAISRQQRRSRRHIVHTKIAIPAKSRKEQIFDRLAAFKIATSRVSMHIEDEWRSALFRQFDFLLNPDLWPEDVALPTEASFSTFLKCLTYLKPIRRPSFGVGPNANLVATWSNDNTRLFLDFQHDDELRWAATQVVDDRQEVASGHCPIARLIPNLAAFDPKRWFKASQ